MTTDLLVVDLPENFAGFIVCAKTGVAYRTQAGGTMCAYPQQEGWLLPFPAWVDFDALDAIDEVLLGEWRRESPDAELTRDLNNRIERVLRQHHPLPGAAWVRTARVGWDWDSGATGTFYHDVEEHDPSWGEAWLPVRGCINTNEEPTSMVLTWPNSD